MKKVCVVILNWNGRDLTLRCLADLRKSDYPELTCVIVENGSTDGSAEAIAKEFPDVGIIPNSTNLGWAAGSNQGIAWGLARGADYLLMLNNDARGDPAMISNLVAAASELQDQATIIPKIFLGSDRSRFWFAGGRVNYWTGLFSNPAYNQVDDGRFDSSPEAEYASGCCILMPREIAERVGGFDASYFSYVEDVEWSIRCRRAGFRIILCPSAKLWHDVSATGKKSPAMMRYFLTRNHLWTLRRYAGPWQFATAVLFLPMRSLWRILRLARAHDGQSIAAEFRGLKDGLLGDVAPGSPPSGGYHVAQGASRGQANTEGNPSRKLKVLACAYACLLESGSPVSGGEAVLGWNLAKQLARFHSVWVLTATSNRPGIVAELQRHAVPNLTFHYVDLPDWMRPLLRFPGGVQFYAYLWQIRAYFAARKLHRQLTFDAFHHITFANDWMASYTGALLPIPFLRGPGGGAHRTPEGFLREYSFGARFWERFRSFGQWVLRHDPFYILSQRRAGVILLCNREAAEAVAKSLRHKVQLFPVNGISAEDLRIIGGVNRREDQRGERGPDQQTSSPRPFEVLYAGKLLGLKGVAIGVRGFALFAKRHRDVRFSLVGDGPERPRLEALIQELGVGDCVHLRRWMPRPELLVLMRASDVFLFPSLRDGGGAVVVEAMAAGKPVICMDLAGPGLHVTENCGIKVPPYTPDQTIKGVAEALDRLYGDRELLAAMGKAARRRVEEAYVLDKLGDRLRGIYESVLGVKIRDGVTEVEDCANGS